jgi:hypothetical protein
MYLCSEKEQKCYVCLNDKHLETIPRWMGVSIRRGKATGELSKDRLESGADAVNGTLVLLEPGTKVLYINYIDGFAMGARRVTGRIQARVVC